MYIKLFIAFVFTSIFSWLLAELFFIILLRKTKKKLASINLFELLEFKQLKIEELVFKKLNEFLLQEETQILLRNKIDFFIKKEFSVVASFIGASLIDKLKQKFILEVADLINEMEKNPKFYLEKFSVSIEKTINEVGIKLINKKLQDHIFRIKRLFILSFVFSGIMGSLLFVLFFYILSSC